MDLNTASTEQLDAYRTTVAKTMNIDPLMLDFIWMNDPETGLRNRVLYAKRGACEILRHELKVSVTALVMTENEGLVTFMATGTVPSGRQEMAVGSAYIEGLRGDKKAHGIMTAQTRAVRRLTLQFVTGGILDETEVQAQTDLQIAPAASGAQLAGSPMVIPPAPQAAPASAPGRDITLAAVVVPTPAGPVSVPAAHTLEPSPVPPTSEPSSCLDCKKPLAEHQFVAGQGMVCSPKPPVSAGAETAAPSETAAPAKVKRTRKPRNTVSISSSGQEPNPPQSVTPAQQLTAAPPAPVSTPAPPAPVPQPGVVAVEKAQPVPAQVPVALPQEPRGPGNFSISNGTAPSAAGALSPEKATEFKNRLRVYSNDVLPKGGMLPSDGIGGVTMKLRKFASVHTGATDTTALALAQWEDLFDFLDNYVQKNGASELVKYIDKAIGVTK